jgi:hypothetical protein
MPTASGTPKNRMEVSRNRQASNGRESINSRNLSNLRNKSDNRSVHKAASVRKIMNSGRISATAGTPAIAVKTAIKTSYSKNAFNTTKPATAGALAKVGKSATACRKDSADTSVTAAEGH